jgi:capsular exopolysaccharide synthesis family protein
MSADHELTRRDALAAQPRYATTYRINARATELESTELLTRCRMVVKRRWPTLLIVSAVVMAAVLVAGFLREDTYTATGVIEIQADRTDATPVDALFAARRVSDDTVQTEVGILRSESLTARVVDDLGLAARPEFKVEDSKGPELDRRRVVKKVHEHLTVDPRAGSRLVAVSFEAHDPELAAAVVNGILDAYTKKRLEDARKGVTFLAQQITDTQKQLQESEQRLQAHVRKRGLQIIETGRGESENLVNDRLRQLQSQLAEVQVDRYLKQSTYEQATARDQKTVDDPVIQSLTVRLAELEREYASLSTTYLDDYPKVQAVKDQIKQTKASLDEQARRGVERLQASYEAAMRRERLLQQSLGAQQGMAVALTGDAAGYESLRREVATNRELYGALDQKLKEVTISASLKAIDVGVVDRAAPPIDPSGPSFGTTVTLGFAVAVLLAGGAAFMREQLDRSVHSLGDVHVQLGVPALAAIPAIRAGADCRWLPEPSTRTLGAADSRALPAPGSPWCRIDVSGRSRHVLDEAFAALRTSVVLADNQAPPCRLLITSSLAGEGKTTVAINLAISLARLSERVLLVDADLRLPKVHEALGLSADPGLSAWLAGGSSWRDSLQTGPLPNLDILVGGHPTLDGPAELTSSPLLRRLLDDAEHDYDFIVIDSPSVLTHPAEVRTLAALADGTLLTVRSGSTPRETVWQALGQLRHTLGIVLNGLPLNDVPDWKGEVRFKGSEA